MESLLVTNGKFMVVCTNQATQIMQNRHQCKTGNCLPGSQQQRYDSSLQVQCQQNLVTPGAMPHLFYFYSY